MSDLVLVALISASFPAVVSVVAAVASIFGPGWRDRQQRVAEREQATETLRYERALEFVTSIHDRAFASFASELAATHLARARLVATLRRGEGAVEGFTSRMMTAVDEADSKERQRVLDAHADQLFGWLRGDVSIEDLTRKPAR